MKEFCLAYREANDQLQHLRKRIADLSNELSELNKELSRKEADTNKAREALLRAVEGAFSE
jgi:predicted  nucleic acid-binding Zn-ribbon protein